MHLKLDSRAPVYIQVIDYFKRQIASGSLEMGEEIPSRRELANKLKINPNTAQRAYKEMEDAGLIFTEGNSPSRITKDEEVIRNTREGLILEAVNHFVAAIKPINVPVEEVFKLIKEKYDEKEQGDTHD